jgi:hypothetical protein
MKAGAPLYLTRSKMMMGGALAAMTRMTLLQIQARSQQQPDWLSWTCAIFLFCALWQDLRIIFTYMLHPTFWETAQIVHI